MGEGTFKNQPAEAPALPLDDTVLLLRHAQQHGDNMALERAFARIRPRLEKWIASRMGSRLRSRLDIEDLVQDSLMAAWKALPGLHIVDRDSFMAWLFKLMENRLRDAGKHHAAKRRDAARECELGHSLAGSQTSPSAGPRAAEAHARMLAALASLPEPLREVLRLVRLEEQPPATVAELLGITVNAVNIRVFRALKALGEALERRDLSF